MLAAIAQDEFLKNKLYWPAPLVMALEEAAVGKGLKWVIVCTKDLLETRLPPGAAQLLHWLSPLYQFPAEFQDGSTLMSRSKEIWEDDQCDLFHRSLAHMFVAANWYRDCNLVKYRTYAVSALRILGQCDYLRETWIQKPLALFEKLME